jgi:hypothetical protein
MSIPLPADQAMAGGNHYLKYTVRNPLEIHGAQPA